MDPLIGYMCVDTIHIRNYRVILYVEEEEEEYVY